MLKRLSVVVAGIALMLGIAISPASATTPYYQCVKTGNYHTAGTSNYYTAMSWVATGYMTYCYNANSSFG